MVKQDNHDRTFILVYINRGHKPLIVVTDISCMLLEWLIYYSKNPRTSSALNIERQRSQKSLQATVLLSQQRPSCQAQSIHLKSKAVLVRHLWNLILNHNDDVSGNRKQATLLVTFIFGCGLRIMYGYSQSDNSISLKIKKIQSVR